jgi:hypothetical protein
MSKPGNTRQWAKRKLSSARGNIDQSGQHIMAVSEVYREYHPEISERLDCVMAVLAECDFIIEVLDKDI